MSEMLGSVKRAETRCNGTRRSLLEAIRRELRVSFEGLSECYDHLKEFILICLLVLP